jgi:hypothetical protein
MPSDFLPSMPSLPDIGPMLGEMMLPSDFIGPGGLGGGGGGFPSIAELMPSLPDIPWDMAGELLF